MRLYNAAGGFAALGLYVTAVRRSERQRQADCARVVERWADATREASQILGAVRSS